MHFCLPITLKYKLKKITFTIALLPFLTLFVSSCDYKQQTVSLNSLNPVILEKKGAELFQYWEFNNDSTVWGTNFNLPNSIKLFEDTLKFLIGKDSVNSLIKRLTTQDSSLKLISTQNGDSLNAQLIHSKKLGKIRPINYLEAQILQYQMKRYPLISHPTEFHGFILLHDSLQKVKVYFAASDRPWPPKPNIILKAIQVDLNTGWTFLYHLHNHYEPKSNNYLGILAPSTSDAQYYNFLSEEYQLKKAAITNGFHTVEIRNDEFSQLRLPANN
jgi:hypothetical protein